MFSASVKQILEQSKSTIDDEGDKTVRDAVIAHSRRYYAREKKMQITKTDISIEKKQTVKNKGTKKKPVPMIDD